MSNLVADYNILLFMNVVLWGTFIGLILYFCFRRREQKFEFVTETDRPLTNRELAEEMVGKYERVQMHAISLGESDKDAKIIAMRVVMSTTLENPDKYGNILS